MIALDSPVTFPSGHTMKNRFMLAPMTNTQSHDDGRLSDDELNWLLMRAKGQFGLVMTCASHVQEVGKGFPGQLGIFADYHIEGHKKLCAAIKEEGSLAVIQLHHAGMRSPEKIIGQKPVCPSDNEKHGARALSLEEVRELRDDFIQAAVRSKECGYDGVEVHGAHGYFLTQFMNPEVNHRTDEYGGSPENRARIVFEIVNGIREKCGEDFLLGLRLSPERYGMSVMEVRELCQQFLDDAKIDFLDVSLWDSFKYPEEEQYKDKKLIDYFNDLNYGNIKLTVAGKISSAKNVVDVMDQKVDFVTIGKAAILHHDYPVKVMQNIDFKPVEPPVSKEYLEKEGLGPDFITYMSRWPNFVEGGK